MTMNNPFEGSVASGDIPDISGMTYEDALKELEGTIAKLEDGTAPLAESVDLFERGCRLRERCESLLEEAQSRIDRIAGKDEG